MLKFYHAIIFLLFAALEIPLIFKFVKYGRNYEFIRQISVVILMILTALIMFGVYKTGLFFTKFVVR